MAETMRERVNRYIQYAISAERNLEQALRAFGDAGPRSLLRNSCHPFPSSAVADDGNPRIARLNLDNPTKETGMSIENLEELLIDELKDLYSAEKQIVRAQPKLAKSATNPELSKALLTPRGK